MVYWLAKFIFIGPLLRLIWRPWAEGLENIPDDRPAILASNHLSFCDSFFMPVLVPRKVTFLAKAEYFTTPGIKGVFSRVFFAGVGQVPIDRDDTDAARAALNTGVRVLRRGACSASIPRAPARRTAGCTAARPAWPGWRWSPACRRHPVRDDQHRHHPAARAALPKLRPRPGVRFGKPLDFSRYEGMAGDRFVERSMTDEIMYELMQLSGQEYVDRTRPR